LTIDRPGFAEGSSPELLAISLLQAADDDGDYPPVGITDYIDVVMRRPDAAQVFAYLVGFASVIARIAYSPSNTGPDPEQLYAEVAEIIRRETARRQ
jgi:hypothetical protein